MRRALRDTDWLTDDSSVCVGVSLGADGCAEHEWGVAGLKSIFGVPKNNISDISLESFCLRLSDEDETHLVKDIAALHGTAVPEHVHYVETLVEGKNTYRKAYLYVDNNGMYTSPSNNDAEFYSYPGDKYYDENKNMVAAWDADGFILNVIGDENVARLRDMYKAIMDKDILFGGGISNNPFGSSGLSFGYLSKLSSEDKQLIESGLMERFALYKKVKSTGILEKLIDAKKSYYALSPRIDKDNNLKFWLNPREQREFNSGWFTVEDLELWCENKGPIPKNPIMDTGMNP